MFTALAFALVLHAQDTVLLRFNPPLQKTYRYAMEMKMDMTMPAGMPGGNMNMSTKQSAVMKAIARKGDITTLETEVRIVKITMPSNSPMAGALKDAENAKPTKGTTQIDSQYKIQSTDVKGGPAGTGAMASGMAAGMSGITFPAKPIRVGQTWKGEIDMTKLLGAMGGAGGPTGGGKLPLVFRLDRIAGSSAYVTMTVDSAMPFSAGGQSMKMQMKGTSTLELDIKSGMTNSMTSSMNVTMSFAGQVIHQHQIQTMKLLG